MRPITVTVGPLAAASANNIAQSQTPGAAGDLTLNGALVTNGVAVLDTARRVLVTPAGNETGKLITLYGTDWNGNAVSETLAGTNAVAIQSVRDYKTITRVAVDAAFAGAVTVGTNGVASSRPIMLDPWAAAQVALQVDISGTVNATVRQTLDDLLESYTGATWVNHPDTGLVGFTATVQGNYGYAPRWVQLLVNSQTNPGFATMTVSQALGPVR